MRNTGFSTLQALNQNPGSVFWGVCRAWIHAEKAMRKDLSGLDHSKEIQLVHFQSSAVCTTAFNLALPRL